MMCIWLSLIMWLPDTDGHRYLDFRVTESGTPDTSANYDRAYKGLRSDTTFGNGLLQQMQTEIFD
jgi:hypothetical protein